MKTVGVLTSGGDAPGMNACIAAIADCAEHRGIELRGVFRGFQGLVDANSIPIGRELAGLARRGGSFLGTSQDDDVEDLLRQQRAVQALANCCVDGLIIIGGGGSLAAAARMCAEGAAVVGVPCSIDNNIPGTDYTIGFDSAVNKVLRAADEILDTAESLSTRIFIIETLGRTTGHLAIAAAYACGADAVLVHEVAPDLDAIGRRITAKIDAGGTHGLVILAEDMGTDDIAAKLEQSTGRKVGITALGHTQRGGNPTFLDRSYARRFGEMAFNMLLSGEVGRMVAYSGGVITSAPLTEVVENTKQIDLERYQAVNAL